MMKSRLAMTALALIWLAPAAAADYTADFNTPPAGWTLDPPVNGVGWAFDATPAVVIPSVGMSRSGNSLNYNNGTNYDGGMTSGSATSPVIALSGVTNPVLKFWDLYQTETRGTAADKRFVEIWTADGATRLAQWQLASVGYSFGGSGSSYLKAGPGPCGETHLDLETNTAVSAWHQHKVFLDPAWGSVRVKFVFQSIDAQRNHYAGWGIDDLLVTSNLTPVPTVWSELSPWDYPSQPSNPSGSKLNSFLFGTNDALLWGWSFYNSGAALVIGETGPPNTTLGSQAELGSSFVIDDPIHHHRHVSQMVDFALWQDQPEVGLVKLRRGARRSYCIAGEGNMGSPQNPLCEDPSATYQRLVGNSPYASGTPEQEMNVAGLSRNTPYYLIGISDPLNRIRESNNRNQHDSVRFILPTKVGERSTFVTRANPYPPASANLTVSSATLGVFSGARAIQLLGTGFDTLMTAVLYDQGTAATEQPFYTIVSSTEMWVPVPATIKFPAAVDLIRASGHLAATRLTATDPTIVPVEVAWDDDHAGGTSGNNNKQLNRGETVNLTVRLGNAGTSMVRGVSATLAFETPDANVMIQQATVTYGDLATGSESNGTSQFRLAINAATPVPDPLYLQLTIHDYVGHAWISPLKVVIQPFADTALPTATITSPANGYTVPAGTALLTLAATVTDPAGAGQLVSGAWGVEFKVDGANFKVNTIGIPSIEDITAPFATTWSLSGVASGPHAITAVVRDAAGNTATSPPITVTIPSDTTPPVISNLAVSSITTTGATVTWKTNEPTTGRWCRVGGNCSGSSTFATSHTGSWSELIPNTLYQFYVTATDVAGHITTSPTQAFVTLANPNGDTAAPSPPPTLAVTTVSFLEISLNWLPATDDVGVVGYHIWRKIGTGASLLIAATTGTTYRDLGVNPSMTYSYSVIAYDAGGNLSTPAVVTVTTPTPDPAKLFLFGWGSNAGGQLGDNTLLSRSTPTPVLLEDVISVGSGYTHMLALRADGTVWAWGNNSSGQLGDGTTVSRLVSVPVIGLPAIVPGTAGAAPLAAGSQHSLALDPTGRVWSWGTNIYGELGDGTVTPHSTPALIPTLLNIAAITSGSQHGVALKADGTVWAWGRNDHGVVGNGTTTNPQKVPVRVSGLPSGIRAIAAGEHHVLALTADGAVWAWGRNLNGQIGIGNTTTPQRIPVAVSGLTGIRIIAIAAGGDSSVALAEDGTVWAWGYNAYGQLGDGTTTTPRTRPVQVVGLDGVRTLAVGTFHVLAGKADGTVWAWGRNREGQLGNVVAVDHPQPVPVAGVSSVTHLAGGGNFSMSLSAPPALLPTVAFALSASQVEEHTGTRSLAVNLSVPYDAPVSVDYAATGGTATGGGVDYMIPSGTITFAPTQTVATVEFVLVEDEIPENDETVDISLSNPSNAVLGGASTHRVTISEAHHHDAPTVTSPTSAGGTIGEPFTYQIIATDHAETFGATGLPDGLTVDPVTGLLSGIPLVAGTFTVTLSAANTIGTGTATLILTIAIGNRAPTIPSQAVTTPEDTTVALVLTIHDPDGDTLTPLLTAAPQHGTLSGSFPNWTYTPFLNYAGSDQVMLRVSDGQLTSAPATITLTVTPINDDPVVTHVAAHTQFLQEDGSVPPIDLHVTDVDSPLSAMTLTARSSNHALVPVGNIQFTGTGANRFAQVTLTPNQSGIADLTLTVSDGQLSDSHGFNLIVNAVNDPPLLTGVVGCAPSPARVGQPVTCAVSAGDADGDLLQYTWRFGDGAQEAGATAVHAYAAPGTYTIQATVEDGQGGSVSGETNVSVEPAAVVPLEAVRSGLWSEPATWAGGRIPQPSDAVQIRQGVVVVYDLPFNADPAPEARTVTIEQGGVLRISRATSTRLDLAGSLLVLAGGTLDVGTPTDPIPEGVRAYLGFNVADDRLQTGDTAPGPVPEMPEYHPEDTGLWVVGDRATATFHGAVIPRPWTTLAQEALAGDTTLTVTDPPAGWQVGAAIVLAPTGLNPEELEQRVLTAVTDRTLTMDAPLQFAHASRRLAYDPVSRRSRALAVNEAPATGEVLLAQQGVVGLLSRNVTLASNRVTEQEPYHRAQAVFLRGGHGGIAYSAVQDFGPRGSGGRAALTLHAIDPAPSGFPITGASVISTIPDPSNAWLRVRDSEGVQITDTIGLNAEARGFSLEAAQARSPVMRRCLGLRVRAGTAGDAAVFWGEQGTTFENNLAVGGFAGVAGFRFAAPLLAQPPALIQENISQTNAIGLAYAGPGALTLEVRRHAVWHNLAAVVAEPLVAPTTRESVFLANASQPVDDAQAQATLAGTYLANVYLDQLPLPIAVPGDLTNDGLVRMDDLRWIVEMLVGVRPVDLTRADLVADGQLSLADLRALLLILISA